VIMVADLNIALGPVGGEEGGRVVATGTPEQVARVPGSYTGAYLSAVLPSRAPEAAAAA
jgi:excinuclease ABC subunit A